MAIKLSKEISNNYVEMLKVHGEDGLYRGVIETGFLLQSSKTNNEPDLEILEYSEAFFSLYRRTGNEKFFLIGKILRRAANTVYRELLRTNENKKPNYKKFLNIVK